MPRIRHMGDQAAWSSWFNACHRAGLAVVLDVVYNHLGPEGNYLQQFAPSFTDVYRTPWGPALNFGGPYSDGVGRFFIDNAVYWLTEFHIDPLRLDAIHGIFDFSGFHILAELRQQFHERARILGRQAWVIAESDLNDVRVIRPRSVGATNWMRNGMTNSITPCTASYRIEARLPGRHRKVGAYRQGDLRRLCLSYDGISSSYRRRRFGSGRTRSITIRFRLSICCSRTFGKENPLERSLLKHPLKDTGERKLFRVVMAVTAETGSRA